MKPGELFPLPWEEVLWSSSPGLPAAFARSRTQYVFTDFRLVVRRQDRTVADIPLHEVQSVRLTQSWWQRLAGTSTVRVFSRRTGIPLELADIRHGPELALILQLRATDLSAGDSKGIDAQFFRSALAPGAPSILRPRQGVIAAATIGFALIFAVVGIARHDSLPPVVYSADDAIAPNGQRRSTQDIIAFMEREVMPFARRALAPIVGGASEVTCETCHGVDAPARQWRMPGVRALPDPGFRFAGLERAALWLDPQVRNAVYGYLAEEDKQSIAAYMRNVVMPGMAHVMKRPAYDFAKSYGYNRARAAVGCYHCHLVE